MLVLSAALAALDLQLVSRATAHALSAWLQFVLALGAAALCARAAGRSAPRGRTFWLLLSLGMLFWASGQALWALHASSLRPPGRALDWDLLLCCSAAPLLLAAGLRPDRPEQAGSFVAFDLALALALALHVYLHFGFGVRGGPPATSAPWFLRVAALRGLLVLGAFAY